LATQQVVDTVATIDAVNRLMKRTTSSSFSVTLTEISAGAMFSFNMSASGTFTVDWGDGTTVETITKSDTTNTNYSHTYASSGTYVVRLGGTATGYNTDREHASAIFFVANKDKITRIDGSLGAIFSTLPSGENPSFRSAFASLSNLTEPIPAELFAGITGAPAPHMFNRMFEYCRFPSIPAGLFAGISGAPAVGMFYYTFRQCTNLTGSIPAGLFAGITGAPAESMFHGTFESCGGLTGAIPAGLFAGISGAPASWMFYVTFYGCTGLTGTIPSGLFGTFTGASATNMFHGTFWNCTGLTGIADGIWDLSGLDDPLGYRPFDSLFKDCTKITSASPNIAPGSSVRLYEKFTNYVPTSTTKPFVGCTGMSDYASIPSGWK
jgi:hypothetical protein